MVERSIYKQQKNYKTTTLFICSYISFLLWNILTTWWIKNASIEGAAMAIFCNALLMSIVIQLYHNTKKRVGEKWSGILFICFWISFEFLHLDWDLTYPWLTLGNVFSANNTWVQWYEYTGVFGGSLWALTTNVFISDKIANKTQKPKALLILVLMIMLPIAISYLMLNKNYPSTKKINVVIVQPNVDPYKDKFNGKHIEHLQKMLRLAEQKTDTETNYLIFPETAITESLWENNLYQHESLHLLQNFIKQHPLLNIVIGASTYKVYRNAETVPATARKFIDANDYYDAFNTALQLDSTGRIQIYHKSKLVPGVEKMPFPFIFKYLEDYAINLGGMSGSLGEQKERTVFRSIDKTTGTAPVVCYESIYGEFVATYISNGADFISIITNDGWWGDTPGYKQHLMYGTLRAIETRKWIARSANTGISCFITPKGAVQQATRWWTPAVIAQTIELNNIKTFYVTYGDLIARGALYASFLFLIYSQFIRFKIFKK